MRVAFTPGLGVLQQTTLPPLSGESRCLRRWLSGQCSGPRKTNWCSGLGHILTTPTEGDPRSSDLLGHTVPYLVGVIFLHPSLAVVLWGRGGRRTQFRVLGSSIPNGPGMWVWVGGGKKESPRTNE